MLEVLLVFVLALENYDLLYEPVGSVNKYVSM